MTTKSSTIQKTKKTPKQEGVTSVLPRFTVCDYTFGILAIALPVLLRFTVCDYTFGILAIALPDLLRFTVSDYTFGIFKLFLSTLSLMVYTCVT
jgi:phage-related holin